MKDDSCLLLALAKELIQDPDSRKILTQLLDKITPNSRGGLEAVKHAVSYKGMGHYRQKPGILSPLLDAILKKQPAEILFCDIYGARTRGGMAPGGAAAHAVLPLQLVPAGHIREGMAHLLAVAHQRRPRAAGDGRAEGQPESRPRQDRLGLRHLHHRPGPPGGARSG